MSLSEAQYFAAIEEVETKHRELGEKISQIMPVAIQAASPWYVPAVVKDAILWCGEKMLELAQWLWDKIVECLKGAAMPILMFKHAWEWHDIRARAGTVSGQLNLDAMGVNLRWSGPAANAYSRVVPQQSEAAAKVSSIGGSTAFSLTACATAATGFYVMLGVILVKFILALVAALAALGSAVFSWAGALLIVEEAGVNSALLISAVAALTAALGAQAAQMGELHGDANDNSAFPGGHWPNPRLAGNFDDQEGWRLQT